MTKKLMEKLFYLCSNIYIFYLCLFSMFFFSLLLIIRIFFSIDGFILFSAAVVLFIFIYLHMPNNLSSKLSSICFDISKQKYEKALKKIDKIFNKNLPKLEGDKKDEIYYMCLSHKGECYANMTTVHEKADYAKKAIEYLEEANKISFPTKKRRDITVNMGNLAVSYLSLGRLQNDKKLIQKSIYIYEDGLDYSDNKNFTDLFHGQIAYAYELLSDFYDKEENLKAALEELNIGYEKCREENFSYSKAYICCSLGTILRKLYEIDNNENYKSQAISVLNEAIDYYKNIINNPSKRYFPDNSHFFKFYLGKSYFQLYKLNNSDNDLKACREELKDARIQYTKEKSCRINNQINEMLDDLNRLQKRRMKL